MTSKAGHTFTARRCEVDGVVTVNGEKTRAGVYTVTDIDTDPSESDLVCEASFGDAHFIAEAFSVAHETGLTPRQLAERCGKLEAMLKLALPIISDRAAGGRMLTPREHAIGVFQKIDTALSKATAGGAV